jgi:hypothetical protein
VECLPLGLRGLYLMPSTISSRTISERFSFEQALYKKEIYLIREKSRDKCRWEGITTLSTQLTCCATDLVSIPVFTSAHKYISIIKHITCVIDMIQYEDQCEQRQTNQLNVSE